MLCLFMPSKSVVDCAVVNVCDVERDTASFSHLLISLKQRKEGHERSSEAHLAPGVPRVLEDFVPSKGRELGTLPQHVIGFR